MNKRKKKLYCVIMAGGKGTRFWPLSRTSRPKQMLNIIGNQSMLQMTVDRLRKLSFVEDIFIVAGADLKKQIVSSIEGVAPENIIIEPSGKNTAPCIGLAALHLKTVDEDPVMGIFPADHLIIGHRKFSKTVNTALRLANLDGGIVTIGIVPTAPVTGYGYIQYNKERPVKGFDAYCVKTFAEKPTVEVAKRFLKSGDFLWNSGMFVWKASTILEAIREYMHELYESLSHVERTIGKRTYKSTLFREWDLIQPESVDYGVLERTKNIFVVKADFQWSDVGSWNAYYEVSHRNRDGNVIKGDSIIVDGKNNLVHSNGRLTAMIGVDDLVVINTDDATLIVSRDRVEDVKEVVKRLHKSGQTDIL